MSIKVGKVVRHGKAPYQAALLHGGPGACGEVGPLACELETLTGRGILEPWQTADSIEGQVTELKRQLEMHATGPLTLAGYSWGAWLALIFAARYPLSVKKLLLLSSGPLDERYAATVEKLRGSRLSNEERINFAASLKALRESSGEVERRAALERLHVLSERCDCFDALPPDECERSAVVFRSDVYEKVWSEAAKMRREGVLLECISLIRCPVIALHGDHDPHPAEGVRRPLEDRLADVKFIELKDCGHIPWQERLARDEYLRRLSVALL